MAEKETEVETGEKVAWQTEHNRYRSKTEISTLGVRYLGEESWSQRWIEMRKTPIAFELEEDEVESSAKYLKLEAVIWRRASQLQRVAKRISGGGRDVSPTETSFYHNHSIAQQYKQRLDFSRVRVAF